MFMNVSVLPSQDLWALCFNRIYETCIKLKSDRIMTFYILCHQMVQYPAVNGNADLEFLYTPQCKVRNTSEHLCSEAFLCPNTAFYGGIRALFLCLKIL